MEFFKLLMFFIEFLLRNPSLNLVYSKKIQPYFTEY
ncbi:hypothetical protein ZPR_1956 [Zunongwangia profunda SM-A87]|uniref:Uncharacterized protein n=1 Tax=Zunongwangia profunda (strain DSM 18752 / CCTCC AB 206139 / SM-A87) TaxID=655815 RepID=D5B9Y3_ZUNPS|nr:hypothetical protein ZPR_1956 [Zunongwangia profunda SM-A87]